MEARVIMIALATLVFAWQTTNAQMYRVDTENFSVRAPDVRLAQRAAKLAEEYRAKLSVHWLGYEIPKWSERCPIVVELQQLAGGETSFGFAGGSRDGSVKATPIGWQMKIFGPADRVLDAVLPHEVTHTIFATHFGRPLPRWADEGACTTVEHESERAKNHEMLMVFLKSKPSRGIPFNRMFTMKQYPHDILPLYAQGYSLVRYLIQQKGPRHFIKYLEAGMSLERPAATLSGWDRVTAEYYGYQDLSELQDSWIRWVKKGCPAEPKNRGQAIALAGFQSSPSAVNSHLGAVGGPKVSSTAETPVQPNSNSWYDQQMSNPGTVAVNRAADGSVSNRDKGFRPGSIAGIDQFKSPNIPARQSATMRSKGTHTIWR